MMIVHAVNVNPNKLLDELISHEIKATITSDLKGNEYIAKNVTIRFDNSEDIDLVQQIIGEHDPIPLPTTPEQSVKDYLLDLDFRLSRLELNL
ncbi:hypothetical protein ACULLL_16565 [Lysinibacillus irui]|uniref:hypothetical protein n=1 Tax=Lysinibacillus irui TaxID=2998077 RepID=UPI0040450397